MRAALSLAETRPRIGRCVAALLALSAGAVWAAERPALEPQVFFEIERQPVYVGGSDVAVDLVLRDAAVCVPITAVLLLKTARLAARADEKTLLECPRAASAPAAGESRLAFEFAVPRVQQRSEFEWEFNVCSQTDGCAKISGFGFSVLPADFLEPLVDWSRKHQLFVHDAGGALRAFLDGGGFEYLETRQGVRAEETTVSLIVLDGPDDTGIEELLPQTDDQRIIVFHEYPSELPVISQTVLETGRIVEVRMPIVTRLADDPAVQKLFYELVLKLSK